MSTWRENIEQIRETLISLANTPSKYGAREDALARLAALTAQMEELERARQGAPLQPLGALTEFEARALRAERRVEELEAALRQIMARCQHPGDYLSMELLHIEGDVRAALAQSDPPEDAG